MRVNRKTLLVAFIGSALVIGGPYWFASKRSAEINGRREATETKTEELKLRVIEAAKVKKDSRYVDAQAALRGAMPERPDIDGAIRALNSLASNSAVVWKTGSAPVQKLDAATPAGVGANAGGTTGAAVPSTTTTIAAGELVPLVVPSAFPTTSFDISISVEGPRANIMNFLEDLRRFDAPNRLFVVDDVSLNVASKPTSTDKTQPATPSITATIKLNVLTFKPNRSAPAPGDDSGGATTPVTTLAK